MRTCHVTSATPPPRGYGRRAVPGSTSADVPLDETQATWSLLASRLDALLQAWEAGRDPPDLAAFLPDVAPPLRRLLLAELIKADLDYRVRRRLPGPAGRLPRRRSPSWPSAARPAT